MAECDYKYEKPDERQYLKGLIEYLKLKEENEIVDILKISRCVIKTSTTFSRMRWNAHSAKIIFRVPIDNLKIIINKPKEKLIEYCDRIMPDELGYDVVDIDFLPLIDDIALNTPFEGLEDIFYTFPEEIINQTLTEDIKQKGKEMAEVYLALYYIENSLRQFIENIGINKYGKNYFDQLEINREIKNNIKGRKEKETKNNWLGIRGDSDLFYLDFEDLSKIIMNNWSIFKPYFPNQNWITTKINEMAYCRHFVAHNSYIKEHGRNVIKTNYISISNQLNLVLS